MYAHTLIASAHSLAAFTSQIALVAGVYGIVTSLSPVLQIIQMRRAGSSESLSRSYIAISVGGYLIWFAYGLAMWNMPLIVSDARQRDAGGRPGLGVPAAPDGRAGAARRGVARVRS
jgi:uncharacterized protein with PQ loop repeat